MKKQIFKLTSILLAMVMVFSLFTIIPISAEGVDMATAVSNLKTAWKALDYNSYMHKTVYRYHKNIDGVVSWDPANNTPAVDAPEDAACTDNFVYDLTGTSTAGSVMVSTLFDSARTTPCMPYNINEVEDIYFYYKTDNDASISTKFLFEKGNGTGGTTNCGFSGAKLIPGTSGEWVKFSLNEYLASSNITFQSRIINYGNVNHTLIFSFGFEMYGAETTISMSNVFFAGDPNLAEARDFTDSEWINKVLDTDLAELKLQYNDAEDSATWTAFVDAFNVVADLAEELPKLDALDELKAAWIAVEEENQKSFVNVLAPEAWWNAAGTKQGASAITDANYGYAYPIEGVTSSGYASTIGNPDPFLFLYGDGAKRFKLNGYADLGFWFKSTGDINARIHLTFGSTHTVTTEVVLVGDNEWHFVSVKAFLGEDTWNSIYNTYKDTGMFRIYVDMGAIVDPAVSSVDVTFGGAYATPAFTGADNLEGEDLVVAACLVDLNRFADSDKKTAFVNALANALVYFPEIEESLAKGEALSNLRTAWVNMIEATPVINSTYTHYGFWNASAAKDSCSTVTTNKYGKAYTRTGVTNTASQFGNGKDTTANLLLYQAGAAVAFGNYLDAGFWYNATSDINVQISLMFASSIQDANIAQGVLTGDGQWHFLSFKEFFGETLWASIRTQYATANTTHRFYVDLGNIVDSNVSSVDVTFGGAGGMLADTTVSAITNDNLVAEAIKVDTTKYLNADGFKAALSAALDFYPEIKDEVEKPLFTNELKGNWQNMTYIKETKANIAYYSNFISGDDLAKFAVEDVPNGSSSSVSYKFNNKDEDRNISYTNGTNTVTPIIDAKTTEIADIRIWYKSTGDVNTSAHIVSTNLTDAENVGTSGTAVLPSTNGEWKEISYIEWFEKSFNTTWNSRVINYNKKYSYFSVIGFGVRQADVDITFGEMTIVPTINLDLVGSDSWSDAEWVVKSCDIALDDYADNAAREAFVAAREAVKDYYTINFAADNVVDAANKLGDVALKPQNMVERSGKDAEGNWVKGAEYDAVFGTSNNGDQFVKVNTDDFGVSDCSAKDGAVWYSTLTEEGLKLADIDDIYFSYKIENKVGPLTVARIFFYEENYSRYLREKNEDGEEVIVYEDGEPVVDKDQWYCGFQAHGGTRYLAIDADTNGWVTTSLATIFGTNWKTIYLSYLNGSDIKTEDFTEENTYITKLAFAFNGDRVDGDYADVSLGSMYVDYADDRFAIDANIADPEAVLAEALALDVSDCKKADADAFKKAVKALADELEADVTKANCVAGNKTANLVDLSLLSRYVDAADKEAFLAANYIDLKAADINGDKVVDEADVAALRVALLG